MVSLGWPDTLTRKKMKKKWQGKSLGRSWQYTIFFTAIRYGGWRLGYFFLFFVVTYYAISPQVAKTCEPYLSRRFPLAKGITKFIHRWRLQWSFGKVLVDRACIGMHNTLIPDFNPADIESLSAIIKKGKGLILLSAHMGAWQTAMLPLSQILKEPITVVLHKDTSDSDKQYFEHGNSDAFDFIDPTQGYKTGIAIANALTDGKILAFMGDRVYDNDRQVASIPFLGQNILLSWGIFYIASVTKAPIAICLTSRIGPCKIRYDVHDIVYVPEDLGKKAEAYLPYLGQFASTMDTFIRQNPYQFFNFYDMWSM